MINPADPSNPSGPDIDRTDDAVTVARRFTYVWGDQRRPHLHPVRTPAGHVLTRNAPDDHPWHHGLWFTIKFVNDENFWEEYDAYGVLRHQGPPTVTVGDDGGTEIAGSLHWIRPDRETVAIVEDRTVTYVPIDDGVYAIDLDTSLVPATDVRLDRTPFTTWGGYGGLTVRGPGDFVDTVLTLADGSTHDRITGTPSPWLDLSGTVTADGANALAGIALFDHPANRRHPVPFYASTRNETYGDDGWSNFANAAFLWDEPMDLVAGETLRVQHRALVHDGHWPVDRLAAEYDRWSGR
ncbi:MAG: PmoA family protein [Actinomycetota bacterium]|nr:PmoA family protein [Actinomycetota bacterium]